MVILCDQNMEGVQIHPGFEMSFKLIDTSRDCSAVLTASKLHESALATSSTFSLGMKMNDNNEGPLSSE